MRLVIFKFHPVDQRCQLVDLLSWTFVVASQILGQLLLGQTSAGVTANLVLSACSWILV